MGAKVKHEDSDRQIRVLQQIVTNSHKMATNELSAFHADTADQIKKAAGDVKTMTDELHKMADGLKADRKTLDARTKQLKQLLK